MYISSLFAALALTLCIPCAADFWLFNACFDDSSYKSSSKVVEGEPVDQRMATIPLYKNWPDVSRDYGIRIGFATDLTGGNQSPEIEIHTAELGRYTWYSGRHQALVDTSNVQVGTCRYAYGEKNYNCKDWNGVTRQVHSYLFCATPLTPQYANNTRGK